MDRYSRKNAIVKGYLIDVSRIAKEVGLKADVAITKALWKGYIKPNPKSGIFSKTAESRLWLILSAIGKKYEIIEGDKKEITFALNYYMNLNQVCQMWLKAIIELDKRAGASITIMLTNEKWFN